MYADNATVLFNDNAVLNTSDGSSTDNTVITYLNNATLGFGSPAAGQNVGRTINGGTLRLAGSNTFKVAADLSNVTPNADKFTLRNWQPTAARQHNTSLSVTTKPLTAAG